MVFLPLFKDVDDDSILEKRTADMVVCVYTDCDLKPLFRKCSFGNKAQWGGLEFKDTLLPITGIKSLTTAILILLLIGTKNFEFKVASKYQIYAMLSRICVNVGWVTVLSMAMPSGTAVLLFFTYPFFALAFSWRTVTLWDFIAMFISSIGVALCVGNEIRSTGLLGITIALLAAVANGSYIHFISKVQTSTQKMNSFIWTELLCSFFALPLFWMKELPDLSAGCGMTLSGFVMALGMFMLLKALSKLKGHESSQILLLQPLLTIVIGVVVLGEAFSLRICLGGGFILSGFFLRFMPKSAIAN